MRALLERHNEHVLAVERGAEESAAAAEARVEAAEGLLAAAPDATELRSARQELAAAQEAVTSQALRALELEREAVALRARWALLFEPGVVMRMKLGGKS